MTYVPGAGNKKAKIFLIGEAPGYEETQQGAPFVGASGYALDSALHDAGLGRHDCYVSNVCRFQPPGNKINPNFIRRMYKSTAKNQDAIANDFIPFKGFLVKKFLLSHYNDLCQEIQLVNPNVIVALGNTPLSFLCGLTGIGDWRGSELLTTDTIGDRKYKVIPTYHPAAVLRNYPWRWDMVQDLRRAKIESDTPTLAEILWNFTIRPNYHITMQFLRNLVGRLQNGEEVHITCDIETRSAHLACIGIGTSVHTAICIPIMCAERPEGYFTEVEEAEVWRVLGWILEHPGIRITNQNYLYDSFYLAAHFGIYSIPYCDTMLAQNVLFPGKEKALGYLASLHCEHYRYWKDDGREWAKKMDEEVLWKYNCMDCCYTFEVGESLRRAIKAVGLEAPYQFQMSMFEPTLRAMLHGVHSDPSMRSQLATELAAGIKTRQEWLNWFFDHGVNPRSPQQLSKLFYTDFAIPPIINRTTHKPTLNNEALNKIKTKYWYLEPPITTIQEIRTLGVYKKTFVDQPGPRDRIYYGLNPGGTKTFRYSSSSNPVYWGTNCENVPKHQEEEGFTGSLPDIRKLYKPDPGYVWVSLDLTKADLHVVVWESGDEELKQQLRDGINIYKEGARVINMPYRRAKMFIHGTNYLGKPKTMAGQCGISVAEAAVAQTRWFSAHPGIKQWQDRTIAQLNATRTVSNKFGYRILFFDRLESCYTEAVAWVPQSTVARAINNAWLRIWSTFPWEDVRVVLQVHDELDLMVKASKASTLKTQILDCFNNPIPYNDPLIIPVDAQISTKSWGDLEVWE